MFLAARDKAVSKPASRPVAKPVVPHREEAASAKPLRGKEPPQSQATPPPSRSDVIPAAYHSTPIGLRYTLIKHENGKLVDVPTNTVFHNGDKIHVSLEVTEPGHLYIVSRGSSGSWEVLFPSAKIENGDNHVEAKGTYQVPQGYVFTFSGQPGTEKLFIVFSRTPEPEIDKLIYSLRDKSSEPASEPAKRKPSSEPQLLASVRPIDDSVVSALRNVYARDLIIEPVNETSSNSRPGGHPEHAVYVVNPKGGADSRLVADISLDHQ